MGVRHRARANQLTNWKPFDVGRAEVRHVHVSERSELTLSGSKAPAKLGVVQVFHTPPGSVANFLVPAMDNYLQR